MKTGDVVVYTERGDSFIATVLDVRELEHHVGKNGEPLLHLGFFATAFEPDGAGKMQKARLVGTHRQDQLAQFRLDVAHVSHEFPAELRLPKYPGGRWSEPILKAEDIGKVPVPATKPKKTDEKPAVN